MTEQYKSHPFLTCKLIDSQIKNMEKAQKYAEKVTYPYLLVLGEKDIIIDNTAAKVWH